MRRIAHICVLSLLLMLSAFLPATSASAGDGCAQGTNPAGSRVYYCGVWVPSGGVPVYAGTSAGSTVVDHLHTGGTANWFYCRRSGGTATASGYSSSDWARTIGDDHGATGYVPAVYFSGVENYWAGLPVCGGSSSPPGSTCTSGNNLSGQSVTYCPVWVPSGGVPVYASTSGGSTVVDHLHTGGMANWFYCQTGGSSITVSGYTSSNWAKTIGDDNGATGYVPAVYFTGVQNYWPGLPACGTGSTNPPPPPGGGGTASGSACGKTFSGIQARTLAMIKSACAQENYIYAWNGGHAATPGPTYGDCSPQNGAPNDCHVIGFDCSGLVRYAYYQATGLDALDGYTWSQWTEAQALHPRAVIHGAGSGGPSNVANAESNLQPGDILFYGYNADEHVAIYLGGGVQINAYESGYHIGVTGVDTGITFWGAVRLW